MIKKREYFETKLKENIARPKDLAKGLKQDWKFAAQTFARFYSNSVESLLKTLLDSPNKNDMNSVH